MPTLPTRRRYKFTNAPVVTTLAANMSSGDTTFTIASGTNWPSSTGVNFWVTIGAGTATEERILCSGASGTTVTVVSRGQDGTTAVGHSVGDTVWVSWSATDADDANAHVSATGSDSTVSVHGLATSSNVVGTTDTQTLTNKTLTSPALTSPSVDGAGASFAGSTSGTTVVRASAVAGSTTVTLPAASGTLVTSGTIVNADVNASAAIAATKIADGSVDNTEFQYLNGVTSAIQTQIDAKAPTASPTFTGTVTAPTVNATTKFQVNGTDVTGLTGAWTTYTSSWTATTTNPTNGTVNAAYVQIGKTVHFRIQVDFKASPATTFGSGGFQLTLPVTPVSTYQQFSYTGILDRTSSGGSRHQLMGRIVPGSTTMPLYYLNSTTGNATVTNFDLNSPVTLTATVGHYFAITGTYEAA